MFCRNCGFQLPEEAKFCLNCGEKTPVKSGVSCPKCSAAMPDGAKFCKLCGTPLTAQATVQPAADETVFAGAAQMPVQPAADETVFAGAAQMPVQQVEEDEATVLLDRNVQAAPSAQTAPVQENNLSAVQAPVQPSSAPVAQRNVRQPVAKPAQQPVKPKKKKGGAGVVVIILLLLLAAAGAAVYFMMFSDGARIEKLTEQAQLCEDNDDYKGAADAYSECLLIGAQDAEIYRSLAEAYLEIGEREKAVETLENGFKATADKEIWSMLTELEDEKTSDTTDQTNEAAAESTDEN